MKYDWVSHAIGRRVVNSVAPLRSWNVFKIYSVIYNIVRKFKYFDYITEIEFNLDM